MKKAESEKAIRPLIHVWRKTSSLSDTPNGQLGSRAFISWLGENYPQYLTFRSPVTGVEYDVDMWFDDELKQNWTR